MLSETKSRYAGEKIIIYLTIASLLNLVGCYYQQQMSLEEYNFDGKEELQVTTKDSLIHSINSGDYSCERDTLFAKVSKLTPNNAIIKYDTKIPVAEIEKIEIVKLDVLETTLIIGGVVLIVAAIIVNIAMGDYGIDF
jgi:hypothetical protein